jgi:hypothetical protein
MGVIFLLPRLFEQHPVWQFLYHYLPPQTSQFILNFPSGALIGIGMGFYIAIIVRIVDAHQRYKNKYQNLYILLTEEGIEYGGPECKFYFDWSEVYKLSKNKTDILIKAKHPVAFAGICIPTWAFETSEQAESFYREACRYQASAKQA